MEVEIHEGELILFESPSDFENYLFELDDKYFLQDLEGLQMFCQTKSIQFKEFEKIIINFRAETGI